MDEYIEVSPSLEYAIEIEKVAQRVMSRRVPGLAFDSVVRPDGTVVITRYTGTKLDVTIPQMHMGRPVKEIGPFAFAMTGVRKVILPEGVDVVGMGAFAECSMMVEVGLPQSLKELGAYAFCECTSLRKLHLPDGLKYIPMAMCRSCPSLTEVRLPQGQRHMQIGMMAFMECSALKKVELPEGVALLREMSFFNSGVKQVSLPSTLRALDDDAFSTCTQLESIEVPEGVTALGSHVFFGCSSLRKAKLPATLTTVAENPFGDCGVLEEIVVAEGNETLGMIGGALMVKERRLMLSYANGNGESFCIVPQGVEIIGDYAFSSGKYMTSIVLPDGVREIGRCAFSACPMLRRVVLPASAEELGDDLFDGSVGVQVQAPAESIAAEYAERYQLPFSAIED